MRDLFDICNNLNDILADLDTAKEGLQYLNESLFGGRQAGKEYERCYVQYQALFHVLINSLYCSIGRFGLIMDDPETPFLKYNRETEEALAKFGEWWKEGK